MAISATSTSGDNQNADTVAIIATTGALVIAAVAVGAVIGSGGTLAAPLTKLIGSLGTGSGAAIADSVEVKATVPALLSGIAAATQNLT